MFHVPLTHIIRTCLSAGALFEREFFEGASMDNSLPDQTRLLASRPILVLRPVDAMQHQTLEFSNAFRTCMRQGKGYVNASARLEDFGCVAGCDRLDSFVLKRSGATAQCAVCFTDYYLLPQPRDFFWQ